jgi:hypothetical protein
MNEYSDSECVLVLQFLTSFSSLKVLIHYKYRTLLEKWQQIYRRVCSFLAASPVKLLQDVMIFEALAMKAATRTKIYPSQHPRTAFLLDSSAPGSNRMVKISFRTWLVIWI